ncbi:MAG TPA: hypothetical protein VGW38_08815 [Chloroflexota bacterium]|nr:hypothetical protein [Chloroflexota bacterium]
MSEPPAERLERARALLAHARKALAREVLRTLPNTEATPEDGDTLARLMIEVTEAERVFHQTTREALRESPDDQGDAPAP